MKGTVAIVGAGGTISDTVTGIVSNGTWSASVSAGQATALVDGSDTVTANVSDAAGNQAATATQSLTVDETAPTVTIDTIAGHTARAIQVYILIYTIYLCISIIYIST